MRCLRILPLSAVLILMWTSTGRAELLGDLDVVRIDRHVVHLSTHDGARLRLTFLADDIVRIQAVRHGEPTDADNGKASIVVGTWPGVEPVWLEHDDHHLLSTATMELVVHIAPLRLELRRRSDGRSLWRELLPMRFGETGTTQTLSSDATERIFGGGQQNGSFQFNGRLMEISYSGGWEEGDRPSPAPFYMSDRGYGVLRNTWTDGRYDFRSASYLTTTHAEDRFDAYVMVGRSHREVLDLYTQLTGRARLLPRWAFGYGDADCYNDGDNGEKPGTVPDGWSDGPTGTTPDVVATVAAAYREHNMPGSWILPNDGYGCGYEELPEVVDRLAELGFRTGLWTEDGVETIAWEVGTAGSRVQKLDVAWTGKGYQWAMDANHDAASGILEHSDSRPFLWTVMGWAGIQRYAVTWTGDQSGSWDYIRWHVPTLIGSALSGMNYSTGDVDGIFGGSPETFTRDLQWKSFTPVLMGMSGWSRAARKHPWWFDEPFRSINRRYLVWRQRLMPYLYSLGHETESTGAPMVRGLDWDYPGHPRADDFPYQFFLGRELLVAPVFRSQVATGGWREGVYLPEGRWIDFWDGRVIESGPGGIEVDIPVDLGTTPVLVRAGAILPLYPESLYDGQVPADPLTLSIYPSGDSSFDLYEDDGVTRQYRDGRFSVQRFTVSTSPAGRIEVLTNAAEGHYAGMLEQRGLVVELHVARAPEVVTVDGLPMDRDRWHFDAEDRRGVLWIDAGRLDVRRPHRIVATFDGDPVPVPGSGYPPHPGRTPTVPIDSLRVAGRPAEEPGHPLENAFDGDPKTWFRSVRDQSAAHGPHEITVSLGGRRMIEGFRIAPRNDRHWKYGQVREYEVEISDANGDWRQVAKGMLGQVETEQEVRFAARPGRLLRFRVLSTHDDADPMVLGAVGQRSGPVDGLAPTRVGPTTISELQWLEAPPVDQPEPVTALVEWPGVEPIADARLGGLPFGPVVAKTGVWELDLRVGGAGSWFHADVGLDDRGSVGAAARFQVWGDDRLLWDSGDVLAPNVAKPRLDIRGVEILRLRSDAGDGTAIWADAELVGAVSHLALPIAAPDTEPSEN